MLSSIYIWSLILYGLVITSLAQYACSEKSLSYDKMRERLGKLSPEIIGGKEAVKGQFPSQVSIRFVTKKADLHFCGGTIITKHWVITAAYCVFWWTERGARAVEKYEKDIPQAPALCMLAIVAGEVEIIPTTLVSESHKRKVLQVISHENYVATSERKRFENNIALLQVHRPWRFSEYIKKLRPGYFALQFNISCKTFGWGYPDGNNRGSKKLIYTYAVVQEYSICNAKVPADVDFSFGHETICASRFEHGPCLGATGGALKCESYLTGIEGGIPFIYTDVQDEPKSFLDKFKELPSILGNRILRHVNPTPNNSVTLPDAGHFECSTPNFPGIFTNVADYRKWILREMKNKKILENASKYSFMSFNSATRESSSFIFFLSLVMMLLCCSLKKNEI